MTNPTVIAALQGAKAAGDAAALAVWERDGKADGGSCGGAILQFDSRTVVAKEALALGIAYTSGKEVFLQLRAPEGVRSQNADIPQAQYRAFREFLTASGYGKAIKRYWSYVD